MNNYETFTVTVAIDPTWHGFDLSDAEKRDIVLAAINARPGLEVAESFSVATP